MNKDIEKIGPKILGMLYAYSKVMRYIELLDPEGEDDKMYGLRAAIEEDVRLWTDVTNITERTELEPVMMQEVSRLYKEVNSD